MPETGAYRFCLYILTIFYMTDRKKSTNAYRFVRKNCEKMLRDSCFDALTSFLRAV